MEQHKTDGASDLQKFFNDQKNYQDNINKLKEQHKIITSSKIAYEETTNCITNYKRTFLDNLAKALECHQIITYLVTDESIKTGQETHLKNMHDYDEQMKACKIQADYIKNRYGEVVKNMENLFGNMKVAFNPEIDAGLNKPQDPPKPQTKQVQQPQPTPQKQPNEQRPVKKKKTSDGSFLKGKTDGSFLKGKTWK